MEYHSSRHEDSTASFSTQTEIGWMADSVASAAISASDGRASRSTQTRGPDIVAQNRNDAKWRVTVRDTSNKPEDRTQ
jgi:hypothetical protein